MKADMITRNAVSLQSESWQKAQAEAVRDPARLLELLELPAELLPAARQAAERFGLRVPLGFIGRMRKGDPNDPLLRQVLPLEDELREAAGYSADPVGDEAARASTGLLHKYRGRVLLITTGACGIHCRYCFRRHYPYQTDQLLGPHWRETLDYIRKHDDIEEVILSGGDPLTLGDTRLTGLIAELEAIPNILRLRIHSRQPVVLPQRITPELLGTLERTRLDTVMVIHANHAREIDEEVASALLSLKASGTLVLNQAVLLAGVNDEVETLGELSRRLFEAGVLPYYLHQLDRVSGAAHFEVNDECARQLMEALRARLPGYLVPTLVREEKGAKSKRPLL